MIQKLARVYSGVDLRIASIIHSVLMFLPFPSLAVGVMMFYLDADVKGYVVLSSVLVFIAMIIVLRKGHLRAAVLGLVVSVNIMVTWSCINGNGIHDIGIVTYPLTILLTAIVLRKRDIWIVSILVCASISMVVLGEEFGLYSSNLPHAGRGADVLIIFFILTSGFVMTSSLSKQIKLSLTNRKLEAQKRKKTEEALAENLVQKTEMLREVHHRVKNHLAFINSLIDIEAMNNEQLMEKRSSLQNRVVAVARVHDQLYQSENYKRVDLRSYFDPIVLNLVSANELGEVKLDVQIDEGTIDVNVAINLALILNEVLRLLTSHSMMIGRLDILLCVIEDQQFSIIVNKKQKQPLAMPEATRSAICLLCEKFDGRFDFLDGTDQSIFEIHC